MSFDDDESVDVRLGKALAEVPGVRLGFLFGSRALGRARKNSDFDIAVLVDEPLASEDPGKTIRALAARLGREVSSERLDLEHRASRPGLGHGGIHLWADENVFNISDVDALNAQTRQPILLTMNCLNGYFHFPYFDSLAEALLKSEDKGVIAAFSPSGLSLDAPAHRLHRAVLDQLLHRGHERLGDALLEAQYSYLETGAYPELLSIYHLLGDPALRLR